jgi:hypothetical protein
MEAMQKSILPSKERERERCRNVSLQLVSFNGHHAYDKKREERESEESQRQGALVTFLNNLQ